MGKHNVHSNPRFKNAHAHRCNEHLEDVFQVQRVRNCFGEPQLVVARTSHPPQNMGDANVTWKTWRHSVSVFFTCLKSEQPLRSRRGAGAGCRNRVLTVALHSVARKRATAHAWP